MIKSYFLFPIWKYGRAANQKNPSPRSNLRYSNSDPILSAGFDQLESQTKKLVEFRKNISKSFELKFVCKYF